MKITFEIKEDFIYLVVITTKSYVTNKINLIFLGCFFFSTSYTALQSVSMTQFSLSFESDSFPPMSTMMYYKNSHLKLSSTTLKNKVHNFFKNQNEKQRKKGHVKKFYCN